MMLLTEEYKKLLREEHAHSRWGDSGKTLIPEIVEGCKETFSDTFLDYGAGRGCVKEALQLRYPNQYNVIEYDPGLVEISGEKEPQPFVICIDVLEHVEPECVDDVLDDLKRLTLERGLLSICCYPAKRILPDGRNAHLSIHDPQWWIEKIEDRFLPIYKEITFNQTTGNLLVPVLQVEDV
jgi:hypothetical protein